MKIVRHSHVDYLKQRVYKDFLITHVVTKSFCGATATHKSFNVNEVYKQKDALFHRTSSFHMMISDIFVRYEK